MTAALTYPGFIRQPLQWPPFLSPASTDDIFCTQCYVKVGETSRSEVIVEQQETYTTYEREKKDIKDSLVYRRPRSPFVRASLSPLSASLTFVMPDKKGRFIVLL